VRDVWPLFVADFRRQYSISRVELLELDAVEFLSLCIGLEEGRVSAALATLAPPTAMVQEEPDAYMARVSSYRGRVVTMEAEQ
jgi:hypothetical protein